MVDEELAHDIEALLIPESGASSSPENPVEVGIHLSESSLR